MPHTAPPIVVVTHFPSPYQVELFNEVEAQRPGALAVHYLFRDDPGRAWSGVPIGHAHSFLPRRADELGPARLDVREAGLVVFNFHNDARAADLIRLRAGLGRPWCYWGERPGYRFPWLSRIVRLGRLRPLKASRAAIWGIGGWAVDAYRREFGADRAYVNLPYYSNLDRFLAREPRRAGGDRTFLYSGSLTRRKGVDLLASAFARLARERADVRLRVLGAGPLAARMQSRLRPCADRVEWIGFKDWNDLAEVYATADVLCVPSRYDGWGLVVPEGLAAGLPVIGTDRTGAALDLIAPGANGWVVAAGSEDRLFDAMREAARLPADRLHAMGQHARRSVEVHSLAAGAARFLRAADEATAG